jgi:RHS repeat-associated protein
MSLPFTNPKNRVDPGNNIVYDAAGNVTTDNQGQTYTYDAEERISSMTHLGGTPTIYKYDSDGNLLYERGPNTAQIILRNLAGQQLAVYSPDGVPEPFQTTEAYVDGELLGDWNNGAFFFASTDTVGTKRFVSWGWGDLNTGTSPQFLESFTSLPFGDALSSIGSDPMHFTGKMRDVASGNDYFGARYYSSSVGRFMSPDWSTKPEAVPYSSLDNPQSLNLYGFVGNNPLSHVDADGHVYNGSTDSGGTADDGSYELAVAAADQAKDQAMALQRSQQQNGSAGSAKISAQSGGSVSSKQIGKVWFNAYGGTAAERSAELAAMSQDLTQSDRGGAMLKALEGRKSGLFGLWGDPKPFDIIQWANPLASYSTQGGNFIVLDPGDIGAGYSSAMGGGTYSLQRIFGHEMGHAAMGNLDNGPGAMNNVNWNENVLMRQLGDFNDRAAY